MEVERAIQRKIDEALREAMERLPRVLPEALRIVRMEGGPYEDKDGDPSYKIQVVYSEDTTYKEIGSAPVHEIKEVVRSRLIEHGLEEFPYFFFSRENEVEAV